METLDTLVFKLGPVALDSGRLVADGDVNKCLVVGVTTLATLFLASLVVTYKILTREI